MTTFDSFDSWWAEQLIAALSDTERADCLRDIAQRAWIGGQFAERANWTKAISGVTAEVSAEQKAVIVRRIPALLSYRELLIRAQEVFVQNTKVELEQYPFQALLRAVKVEEDDRKHGVRPTYRIDDVCLDDDWRS